MKIGDVFRYSRPFDHITEIIEGFPNYFHFSYSPGHKYPILDRGINPIQEIYAPEGLRRPAILISSSPHKIGSFETPWQDFYDPDNGHIRYFGDNKKSGLDPSVAPGNKILLESFRKYSSRDKTIREQAPPLLFFKRVRKLGRVKGFIQFQGFGIIHRVELISQFDRKYDRAFSNYSFDFVIFSLATEHEEFNWDWVTVRRNKKATINDTLQFAPNTWKDWINNGNKSLERCRRRVSKLLTTPKDDQRPIKGSRDEKVLIEIYKFYEGGKSRFEALAAIITERVISETGGRYQNGWITPPSSDGGSDYIGKLEIGSHFSKTSLVVLGQAKCERLNSPTSGNHIARTVARLKRGYIGVYVTTSYFSESVQREVIEDKYPIILIHGKRVAQEVLKLVFEKGYLSVQSFLEDVDSQYDNKIQIRRPEEILLDR